MKKCPFCGADIEESARFCLFCMRSLTEKKQILPHRKKKPQWLLTIVAIVITLLTPAVVWFGIQFALENGTPSDTSPDALEHIHNFNQKNTASTYLKSPAKCAMAAIYYYSCSCGAKGSATFTSGTVLPHTFGDWIVDTVATCVEPGKRHHVCTACQQSVSETYSDPNHHNYDTAWTVDDTHHWHKCLNCGGMSGKTAHNIMNGFCTDCGVRNVDNTTYTRDGNYIYFGEYPQSLKADDVTITANMDVRGYYIGSDGCYYAKVYADPRYDTYTFQSGALVEGLCYFKVEPIRWRILSEDGDTALILCDSVIANKEFDENNGTLYSRSSIRNWLNDRFYNTVFNEIQRRLIDVVLIDDRADANAINDRVFLLSYGDVTNADYGFDPSVSTCDTSRCMTVSDYARATGADMSTSAGCYGNGTWWLRTHYSSEYERYAPVVSGEGCADGYGIIRNEAGGVLPALKIRLNDGIYRLDDATVLVYKVNEDGTTCTITGVGTCAETEVVIPAEIDRMKVTSIDDYAFEYHDNIKSITIPDSVTSIGNRAFYRCTSLESITIPGSVTSIGDRTFCYCTSLESITIPGSITSIGDRTFYGCTSLESITITGSVTSIGDYAFGACDNLKSVYITDIVAWLNISFGIESSNPCAYGADLFLNGEKLTNLVIPDNVTSIGDYAFSGCKSLESIIIPDSVTSIASHAFYDFTGLKSITIPDSITSIGDDAFMFLHNLESVTIGNSVTSIGRKACYGCNRLTQINYRGTISQWNDIYKAPEWNSHTGSYTVYCTDGKITKGGTVTYY